MIPQSQNVPKGARAWSMLAKVYHTYIPSMVGFTVCFASASTVPAQPWLETQFGVGEKASLLPFSLFILGLAFGPVLAAPISEIHGRRPVYILSVLCFMLFILGAGFSTSLASLIVCRLLAGAFGGSALVVGFGLLSDIWGPSHLPIALSIFNTIPFCGPAIGQLVASFIVVNKPWPWTQWVTIFLSAFTWVSILPMRETYEPSIERRLQIRANSASVPDVSLTQKVKAIISTIPLVRPLHMLIKEPVVCLFALYVAFNFAAVYCFSASIPYAFMVAYDFGIEEQGLVFISLVVGYILSAPTMIFPFNAQIRRQARESSADDEAGQALSIPLSPEQLLWPAMLGSLALPIAFFWFGWSIQARIHWICPTFALALFSWGNNLLYNSAQLYLLDTYGPKYGSSATAANNLIRYILAAILPLFMTEMYSRLGTGWAASVLGFILLLFLPIPWAFYQYGPWLRAHSSYITAPISEEKASPGDSEFVLGEGVHSSPAKVQVYKIERFVQAK